MNIPLHWHTEPLLLLLVVGVSWAHAMICGPYRLRYMPSVTSYPVAAAVKFHLGVLVGYLAVGSPLDQIGEGFLFSAHMTQHMLMIYVSAPLLVAGFPAELIDPWLEVRPRLVKFLRLLVHPLSAGIIFNFAFSVWHFPELYDLALRDRTIHIIEHWCIFVPGILMVWPLISPSRVLPRIGFGAAMIYSSMLMVADLPLWAALIFAEHPIYETYMLAPRICWLSASEDMIMGAVIMKACNEVFALSNMAWAFFAWYRKER